MRRRNVDHVMVASVCRANPGQWQEVGEYSSSESASAVVRSIRGALKRAGRPSVYAPAGAFEARQELTEYGARVDARYVGEPIQDVETAVCELGALPVPAGSKPLQEETLEKCSRTAADATPVDFFRPGSDRLTRTFAPTQVLRNEDQAEAPALVIYCAQWDSVPLGQYTTQIEARKHAEDHARRDLPTAAFDWIEDEEDGVAELVATVDDAEGPTGYVVTALEIASKYDPEAAE
ncbi:hypothetical protein K4B79_18940 [Streptomyces lincolnensis]|uniref:hypothetical protein n=1 Tax=Streptomyces lincolnensis TaxID=1915 RepID=UPI001E60A0FA|nr:hypothetical protein [Streptomyces lincolnensis]MCD7440293.1 hypothetical protein [Streptomyces lincolnensis]